MTSDRPAGGPRRSDADGFLEVGAVGSGLLVEDLGRSGWAHLGVPPSGALDPDALMLANRLVGNDPGDAGLEILLGGASLTATRSIRAAVVGADMPVRVDGRPGAWGEPISIPAGAEVVIGRARAGLRAWLAVDGGIAVEEQLGSASTDTLTGIGPAPVEAGHRLPLGPRRRRQGTGSAVPRERAADVVGLGIQMGPRDDWLTSASASRLSRQVFAVSADCDRVGVRLDPADGCLLERARPGAELPSEGIVTGAVQATADGRPLIFLADHPVTGGYPVVAVVDRADLWRCAQLRPGDLVRFDVAAGHAFSAGAR
jgi:biotin-dependent carboxylase-like uncharacterized protein